MIQTCFVLTNVFVGLSMRSISRSNPLKEVVCKQVLWILRGHTGSFPPLPQENSRRQGMIFSNQSHLVRPAKKGWHSGGGTFKFDMNSLTLTSFSKAQTSHTGRKQPVVTLEITASSKSRWICQLWSSQGCTSKF